MRVRIAFGREQKCCYFNSLRDPKESGGGNKTGYWLLLLIFASMTPDTVSGGNMMNVKNTDTYSRPGFKSEVCHLFII